MKVYSDVVRRHHIYEAARGRTPGQVGAVSFELPLPNGVYVDEARTLLRPRLRKRAWNVRLGSLTSRRHRNSGTHGAATWEAPAASWDDHGRWIARLFTIDPHARIGIYDGAEDFHHATKGMYA